MNDDDGVDILLFLLAQLAGEVLVDPDVGDMVARKVTGNGTSPSPTYEHFVARVGFAFDKAEGSPNTLKLMAEVLGMWAWRVSGLLNGSGINYTM